MIDRCLIDTDILLAAYTDIDLGKKEIARNLILKLYADHRVCIGIQNYQEYAAIARTKLKISDKKKIELDLANIKDMFEIIHYNQTTVFDALNLSFEKNISFYDALLLQTMLDNKITTIYSFNDKNHKRIKGIKVINPITFKKLLKK